MILRLLFLVEVFGIHYDNGHDSSGGFHHFWKYCPGASKCRIHFTTVGFIRGVGLWPCLGGVGAQAVGEMGESEVVGCDRKKLARTNRMTLEEVILMEELSRWANLLAPPSHVETLYDQSTRFKRWRSEFEARQKLVANFPLREHETNVFIHWWVGERLSYPSCHLEKILTDDNIAELNPNDPTLKLFKLGWNSSVNKVKIGEIKSYVPDR